MLVLPGNPYVTISSTITHESSLRPATLSVMRLHDMLDDEHTARIVKKGPKVPYIIHIKKPSKQLLFFGSQHITDPQHPQFTDIENKWDTFIKNARSPIALVEGSLDQCRSNTDSDRTESVRAGGESQFAVHLARRDDIPIHSPEPNMLWEADLIAKEYGTEVASFFYFMRQINWYSKRADVTDIEAEAKIILATMRAQFTWHDISFTLKGMEKIHQGLYAKPMNLTDSEWTTTILTTVHDTYTTNRVSRRSEVLRDRHILAEITRYWQQDHSMFIVFGLGHAIRLEPALRALS